MSNWTIERHGEEYHLYRAPNPGMFGAEPVAVFRRGYHDEAQEVCGMLNEKGAQLRAEALAHAGGAASGSLGGSGGVGGVAKGAEAAPGVDCAIPKE